MGEQKTKPVTATKMYVAECKWGSGDLAEFKAVEIKATVVSGNLATLQAELESKAWELAQIKCGTYHRVQSLQEMPKPAASEKGDAPDKPKAAALKQNVPAYYDPCGNEWPMTRPMCKL